MNKRVPTEKEIAKKHGVSVDYVTRQAEVGSTVEREHVTTHEEAYGIALQHVMEFPDYYKHLLPMEKQLKKEWKKKDPIKEDHIPIAMGKMLDSEGGMIKNQIETIQRSCELLRAQIKSDDMQVPAWVQAKITLATENILTCANYMAGKDEEVKEGMKSFGNFIQESEAWQRKEGQNKNGGLNQAGRDSYNAKHGGHLKAPSKKVGNPRRASFCARMRGMKDKLTSKETASDPNSRINKSLRAWNC